MVNIRNARKRKNRAELRKTVYAPVINKQLERCVAYMKGDLDAIPPNIKGPFKFMLEDDQKIKKDDAVEEIKVEEMGIPRAETEPEGAEAGNMDIDERRGTSVIENLDLKSITSFSQLQKLELSVRERRNVGRRLMKEQGHSRRRQGISKKANLSKIRRQMRRNRERRRRRRLAEQGEAEKSGDVAMNTGEDDQ